MTSSGSSEQRQPGTRGPQRGMHSGCAGSRGDGAQGPGAGHGQLPRLPARLPAHLPAAGLPLDAGGGTLGAAVPALPGAGLSLEHPRQGKARHVCVTAGTEKPSCLALGRGTVCVDTDVCCSSEVPSLRLNLLGKGCGWKRKGRDAQKIFLKREPLWGISSPR